MNVIIQANYDAAIAADDAYSAVICELYGPKATRWSITAAQACHPAVNAALKAKLDADNVWLATFQSERETEHTS